jgi:general secretion pathway protein N
MIWVLAGIVSMAITMMIFLPASWMASLVEQQTDGRLTLGDAQGTLWRGSAFIGGAASGNDPLTPLLPGRFSWSISPMVLLGSVKLEIENQAALSQPINVSGTWKQWQISPSAIELPAERLASLGAPLNTVLPSGQMRFTWGPLQLTKSNGIIELNGVANLEINDIASRMSPIKPLGSYNLAFNLHGTQASIKLATIKGPMILNGTGVMDRSHLQFTGRAEAETGQEERLMNFLSLLGQKRKEGDKNFIALEFK